MNDLAHWIPVIVAGFLGYVVGTVIEYRSTTLRGRKIIVPQVTRSSRNFTLVVLGLSVLTAGTVIQTNVKQAYQDGCNSEFKRVIATNAGAGAEVANVQDDLWLDIRGLFGPEGRTVSPEQIAQAIDNYLQERAQAKMVRESNQYPDPQCF
jgi:propanediol dehydratase small subunit